MGVKDNFFKRRGNEENKVSEDVYDSGFTSAFNWLQQKI